MKDYLKSCNKFKKRWLISQFNLYGNLCKGRNVIWKLFLQDVLTTQFLFSAVWDTSFQDLRTPFFNLLISLYIDQYPLEVIDYPEYLKVLSASINRKEYRISYAIKQKLLEDQTIAKNLFKPLLKNLNKELEKGASELKIALKEEIEAQATKSISFFSFSKINKANSMEGLFNLVELLLKLDIHELVDMTESLSSLVKSCLTILEYSVHYLNQIVLLEKIETKNKKERSKIQTLFQLITGNEMKEDKIRSKKILFDNHITDDNPLIRNFFYIKSFLNKEMHDFLEKEDKEVVFLKLKILNIYNRIMDKRQNFLIENVTCWAQKIGEEMLDKEYTKELEKTILEKIESDLLTTVPEIMKTGVRYLDKQNKKDKFVHFIEDDVKEIYDFDFLLENKPSNKSQTDLQNYKEILPSLLVSIMTCVNPKVEAESIKLLLRCFNQRAEFVRNLKEVYLLTDKEGVLTFKQIREVSVKLEIISKRLEVNIIF